MFSGTRKKKGLWLARKKLFPGVAEYVRPRNIDPKSKHRILNFSDIS
jgi:hypothetical protein